MSSLCTGLEKFYIKTKTEVVCLKERKVSEAKVEKVAMEEGKKKTTI